MNAIAREFSGTSVTEHFLDKHKPMISFESASNTLILDDIEIRLDLELGDDDLEVSLLVESLELQYREQVSHAGGEPILNLQSAKEWVKSNRHQLSGLFRHLKLLSKD